MRSPRNPVRFTLIGVARVQISDPDDTTRGGGRGEFVLNSEGCSSVVRHRGQYERAVSIDNGCQCIHRWPPGGSEGDGNTGKNAGTSAVGDPAAFQGRTKHFRETNTGECAPCTENEAFAQRFETTLGHAPGLDLACATGGRRRSVGSTRDNERSRRKSICFNVLEVLSLA